MTSITIEITDEQAEALAQEAERLKLSVQDLAVQRLLTPKPEQTVPDFDAAMNYVFEKNPELYRRLA
jgi:hypothetical protein